MSINLESLDLEEVKPFIQDWAKNYSDIHAVVAFGSRAKRANRPDSDLDLCVIVGPFRGETWYTRWMFQADQWKSEVLAILKIPADKLQFCTLTSPQVKSGLEDGCKFLYLRENNPDTPDAI